MTAPEQLPDFDAVGAVLAYVRARGTAPENDILRALEAREEDYEERHDGADPYPRARMLRGHRLLADLVESGRLRWRAAPGAKGDLSVPLLYSLGARERRGWQS